MNRALVAQTVAISGVCALLAAKVPSLGDGGGPVFSWVGAGVGATIALVAVLIGSFVSSVNPGYEPSSATPQELQLLRVAVIGLCVAVASFTAYLYFPAPWLKATIGTAVVVGVVAVFVGLIVKHVPRRGGDV
jgi:hypothetical protein